jgi:hypothetical protein
VIINIKIACHVLLHNLNDLSLESWPHKDLHCIEVVMFVHGKRIYPETI